MDPHELISVNTCTNATEAEVIRAALEAEGIPCQIEGEGQAGLAGILKMRLLVRAADADQARDFIERHEAAS